MVTHGFNDSVTLVVMPRNKFADAPESMTIQAKYNETLYLPAEHILNVLVSPNNYVGEEPKPVDPKFEFEV